MYKLLFHLLVLTLFIGLINKCVGDGKCEHPCVGGDLCNSKQFLGTCYYLYKDRRRNWYESHQFCAAQKLSMVKFTKEMLNEQFSINDINPLTNDIWLGGRAIDLGKWVFLNNAIANKTDLFPSGEFEDQYQHACGNIHFTGLNLAFGLNDCTTISQYFICRYARCEGNADCLKLHRENLNWFKARSNCVDSRAELFYLKDNETLNSAGLTTESEIYKSIKEHNMFVHVGLRHQRWEWIDGTEIRYTNWDSNGPDKVDENCLLLNGVTGKWSDHDCFEKQLAFCEGAAIEKTEHTSKPSTSLKENTSPSILISSAISYSTSPRPTSDVMAVPWTVITIALGSLLGVFFLITLALVIFLFCRKCRNKSTDDDAEFIENNYYDSSSEPIERTPVAAPSNSFYTNSETVAETLSSHHRTVPKTNGATAQSNEKPRIWPKPIFGPKTGDVYSSVEKVNKSPLRPFKSAEYVNTT